MVCDWVNVVTLTSGSVRGVLPKLYGEKGKTIPSTEIINIASTTNI
jgi:hypothetical protein